MDGKYKITNGDFEDVEFAGTDHKVTFYDDPAWGRTVKIEATYTTPGVLEYLSDLVSGYFGRGVTVPVGRFRAGNAVTGYEVEFNLDPINTHKHLSDDHTLPSGTHLASVSLSGSAFGAGVNGSFDVIVDSSVPAGANIDIKEIFAGVQSIVGSYEEYGGVGIGGSATTRLGIVVKEDGVYITGSSEALAGLGLLGSVSGVAIGEVKVTNYSPISDHCFKADTPIQMWPLDPSIKRRADGSYDEQLVLSKVWEKLICDIQVGDLVVSYDDKGRLQPGPVIRTMTNTATHLLDFWGVGVTPGHAYYCADGEFKDRHVPLIDILRTDGVIKLADGGMVRAATNCKVGSIGDMMIYASATLQKPDGTWTTPNPGKVRFGTRIILPDGRDMSFLEMAAGEGWRVTDDGYMVGMQRGEGDTFEECVFHFPYSHGEVLPKPEDYILARSAVSLEAIYAAGEWEQIGTQMPAPAGMVGWTNNHGSALPQPSRPKPNIPPAFAGHPDAPIVKRGSTPA